jgi:quaternary ammonium compound-resistance protein SugE
MGWVYLLVAGMLEIVWATALKFADGFTNLWPSLIGIAAAVASFLLLTQALETLPVGTAYAAWAGIGVGGVAVFGMLVLGEPAAASRLAFLTMILVGIVGLKLVDAT